MATIQARGICASHAPPTARATRLRANSESNSGGNSCSSRKEDQKDGAFPSLVSKGLSVGLLATVFTNCCSFDAVSLASVLSPSLHASSGATFPAGERLEDNLDRFTPIDHTNFPNNIISDLGNSSAECSLVEEVSKTTDSVGKITSSKVTHETIVMEAWEVVNEMYLDARHKGWSPAEWEEKRKEIQRRPPRSRMAAYSTISTMLSSLNDPYSRFLTPSQFAEMSKYDITGVGLNFTSETDESRDKSGDPSTSQPVTKLTVLGILLGSPAQLSGIRQGDEILSINGTPVSGLSSFEAASLIQGTQGPLVTLQFRHSHCSPVETVQLQRSTEQRQVSSPVAYRVETEGQSSGPWDWSWSQGTSTQAQAKSGYIRLNEFNALAKKDLLIALDRLASSGVSSLTLDLRDNPGGLVQAGLETAKLFLPPGTTLIYTETRGTTEAKTVTPDAVLPAAAVSGAGDSAGAGLQRLKELPLTILVNNRTASASEIVAAALHDNCRALLVGDTTYGKGLIQSVYELSDGSAMCLTVGKYVTPAHRDIDGRGIQPDFGTWPGEEKAAERIKACFQEREIWEGAL